MQIWSAEIKDPESLYTSIKGRFPELEKELIEKVPTTNLTAYNLFIMANEYRRDYEKILKRITN